MVSVMGVIRVRRLCGLGGCLDGLRCWASAPDTMVVPATAPAPTAAPTRNSRRDSSHLAIIVSSPVLSKMLCLDPLECVQKSDFHFGHFGAAYRVRPLADPMAGRTRLGVGGMAAWIPGSRKSAPRNDHSIKLTQTRFAKIRSACIKRHCGQTMEGVSAGPNQVGDRTQVSLQSQQPAARALPLR
jgi:hypothetical protein